jgi:hypothetical protein
MKNIHLQPTSQLSRLVKIYNEADKKLFELKLDIEVNDNFKEYQNIYITSDEEIKDGDWLIVNDEDVMQMKSSYDNDMSGEDIWVGDSLNGYATYKDNCKKIILTTDQNLINDGVQAIDDEFLEWFVKNPSCESVEVQNQYRVKSGTIQEHKDGLAGYEYYEYKIIIPKEEAKQEIVGYRLKPSINRMMVDGILKNAMPVWNDEDKSVYFIKGHVGGSLVAKMKELQVLDLWFTPIYEEVKSDWAKEHHLEYYHKEGIMKAKQETVEEAAERLWFDSISQLTSKNSFIQGAKWQQEQDKNKYSEEDMFTFSQWISHEDWVYLPSKDYWVNEEQEELEQKLSSKEILNLWFEKFKKK